MYFMQPSEYPKEHFTQEMRPARMHLFTFFQVLIFVVMYVVKSTKSIAIAFPLVIALCIPFRLYALPKIFTDEELLFLDSEDEAIEAYLAFRDVQLYSDIELSEECSLLKGKVEQAPTTNGHDDGPLSA